MRISSPLMVTAVVACLWSIITSASFASGSIRAVASEIGITPESMILAGCSLSDAQSVLSTLAASTDQLASLRSQHLACESAATEVMRLRDVLASDPENSTVQTELVDAEHTLNAATAELTARQSSLSEAVLGGLDSAEIAVLTQVGQLISFQMPPAYCRWTTSPDDWRVVEVAIRAEARSERNNAPLGDEHANMLATVRSDPQVQLAQSRLDSSLDAMREVFRGFAD